MRHQEARELGMIRDTKRVCRLPDKDDQLKETAANAMLHNQAVEFLRAAVGDPTKSWGAGDNDMEEIVGAVSRDSYNCEKRSTKVVVRMRLRVRSLGYLRFEHMHSDRLQKDLYLRTIE